MLKGKRLRTGHDKIDRMRKPIDLADYTRPVRQALKRGGYACVYVAAVASPERAILRIFRPRLAGYKT